MQIELKDTFNKEIINGFNLFLGAGFSVYAKDIQGKILPTGKQLSEELIEHFKCPNLQDLPKICTIIDSYASDRLKEYLISRFTVSEYNETYKVITRLNISKIFTTNIDNLIQTIFATSNKCYLNNVLKNGASFNERNAIDYIPIHGTVEEPDEKFLFNSQELASSFNNKRLAWSNLSIAAEQSPSMFIGYSLGDVGALEALFGNFNNPNAQKNRWIVLRKNDNAAESYFKALGFKIIVGDTLDILKYLETLTEETVINEKYDSDSIFSIFPNAKVPKNVVNIKIRPIDEFFLGDAPIWSDVLSNRIFTTSHKDHIINLIEAKKDVIVTGIPASGKSTLLLQIAKVLDKTKRVMVFNEMSYNKSNIIKK